MGTMKSNVTYKKPLGVGQVAAICRVSKKTVLNWIYDGALKAFTTYGGHYRIWPANVKKFLDSSGMDIPFDYVDDTKIQILIIDDEPSYTQMLSSVISAEIPTAEITTTDDGYEGLLLIGEIKPQLVILDIKMPKVDGLQVLELLRTRKNEHNMRILVVSGHLDLQTKERLSKTVADQVLEKLADINLLLQAVTSLVRPDAPAAHETTIR